MPTGSVGLADLVRAKSEGDAELQHAVAGMLGYVRRPAFPKRPETRSPATTAPRSSELQTLPLASVDEVPDIPFLQPLSMHWSDEASIDDGGEEPSGSSTFDPLVEASLSDRPQMRVAYPWNAVGASLRDTIAAIAESRALDSEDLVRRLSRGERIRRLPGRRLRRWGPELHIVIDTGIGLVPLDLDQSEIVDRLADRLPERTATVLGFNDGDPTIVNRHGAVSDWSPPRLGSAVLALTDLGMRHDAGITRRRHWAAFGRRIIEAGCRPVALVPGDVYRVDPEIARVWDIVPWDMNRASEENRRSRVAQRLLTLLSPAVRVEPGLIRQLRMSLPDTAGTGLDVEIEAWNHQAFSSQHPLGATFDPEIQAQLRTGFEAASLHDRRIALACLSDWHREVSPAVWFEEVAWLSTKSQKLLPDPEDVDRARRYFAGRANQQGVYAEETAEYLGRLERRKSSLPADDRSIARSFHRIWWHRHHDDPEAVPPSGYDPGSLPPEHRLPLRRTRLNHQGTELFVTAGPDVSEPAVLTGSLIGDLTYRRPELFVDTLPRDDFWASGSAPSWAHDWGHDEFGAWCAFEVGGAVQRLRWIPPGVFMMGSPEDEPGRYDNESPQHRVVIAEGFWLAETPCTQALWQAVTGENPSRLPDPERPVEQVSWDDVKDFIKALNDRVSGVEPRVPSEAQWEFACRVGTETPVWVGPMEILGVNNAPVLDEIAWYGGNSGVGFDLEDGWDSSDWAEKQHQHEKAGTRKVGLKKPNPLGLHDMLGNVFEWCADHWHGTYDGAPDDGNPWLEPADAEEDDGRRARVIRGGSWDSVARYVRSAYRIGLHPDSRDNALGFRLARVQQGAAPARGGRLPPAERRDAPTLSGDARMVHLQVGSVSAGIPEAPAIRIASDVATLHLKQITKPAWASAIGRDVYGLWTEFELPDGDPSARQRLRWIPPGQFMMGSPEDEAERRNYEGPQHPVRIATGYWLADTACTQAVWKTIMGENPSRFKGDDLLPVETVSWDDVRTFLQRLNERLPGLEAVLPSEAQWEHACRAGTYTPFSTGKAITTGQANFDGNYPYDGGRKGKYRETTLPVRSFRPNLHGLWQMHGNVWEWCADHWHGTYDGAPDDGSPWLEPADAGEDDGRRTRVIRGGSWDDDAGGVRSAHRLGYRPGDRDSLLGFRLARVQQQ
jgi:formylglycine-generating enzyme required for sulfatase activity